MTMRSSAHRFDGHEVTTLIDERDSPAWFADEVCAAIGIVDHRSSTRFLDAEDKGQHRVHSSGRPQQSLTLNRAGLHGLLIRSRKPAAKRFKRWITHEVLPSIRGTSPSMAPASPLANVVAKLLERMDQRDAERAVRDDQRAEREARRQVNRGNRQAAFARRLERIEERLIVSHANVRRRRQRDVDDLMVTGGQLLDRHWRFEGPFSSADFARAMQRHCDARQAHLIMTHLATHEGRATIIDSGVFNLATRSWIRTPRYQPLTRAQVDLEGMS